MPRDASTVFTRAERLRRGGGFTQDDVQRLQDKPRVWNPCAHGKHNWRILPGGYRCSVLTCKVFSRHGNVPAGCPKCLGVTCTSGEKCPKCGGIFP